MNYKFSKLFVLFVLIIGSFLFINNIVLAQTTSCSSNGLGPWLQSSDFTYEYNLCTVGTQYCYNGQQCVPDSGAEKWTTNSNSSGQAELGAKKFCGKAATCVTPSFDVTTSKTGELASTATVTPSSKTVTSGSTATFSLSSGVSTPAQGSCLAGSFSGDKSSYTTGVINAGCNVIFNFPAPTLSCAVDTSATPAPHLINTGVKFLATGGTGTYSWNAAGSTGDNGGTDSQIWPAWSTTGTKTVTVTSGTQTATCNVNITAPTLSCAHDTNQAEPIYPNAGAKFRATGGTGTYSWTYSATPASGNPTSGIEVWPAWSDSGTKTATVTSGTQTASCTVYITPTPPTPVNGLCATPEIHNNCDRGTSQDTADTSSHYTWNCNGLNGGTNDSCLELKSAMSGTLDVPNCVISQNASSCSTIATWSTVNPVGISNVTSNTPSANTVIGTGNSGSTTTSVSYNSRTFYLNNNGVQLASDTASATCAAGTLWNGSICAATAVTGVDLTASAPTPAVATVNVATIFSTTILNSGSASTVNSFNNFFQVASSADGGGTISNLAYKTTAALGGGASRTVTAPSYTFTTTGVKSVRACADKSNSASTGTISETNEDNNCSPWTNVTVNSTAGTVTGYHDQYSGTVPASQCQAVGWAAYSGDLNQDLNIKILSDGVQVATGIAGTYRGDLETAGVCPGGTCSYWINLSGLITPGVNHTITAQAQNPTSLAWTTLIGSPKTINCTAPTTGTISASPSQCVIASGANSCNTTLTWSTTNPVGTSNVTSNTPSSNFVIATANSGSQAAPVYYNSRTFYLNNNSAPIATVTATAICASGTNWNGSSCQPTVYSCPGGTICDGTPVTGTPGQTVCGLDLKNYQCTPSGWSNLGTSCVCPVVSVSGVCSNPDNHLNPCSSGTPSTVVNDISSWNWNCAGSGSGTSESCVELKKKPIIIED